MSGDILDLIDGALEASGDAMRWVPPRQPNGERIAQFVDEVLGVELTDWQRRLLVTADLAPAFRRHLNMNSPCIVQSAEDAFEWSATGGIDELVEVGDLDERRRMRGSGA